MRVLVALFLVCLLATSMVVDAKRHAHKAKKSRSHLKNKLRSKNSPPAGDDKGAFDMGAGEHAVESVEALPGDEPDPWNYDISSEHGPTAWDADSRNRLCRIGEKQSPVDIQSHLSTLNVDLPDIEFDYGGENFDEEAIDPDAVHIVQDEYLPEAPERGAIINTGHYMLIHWAKDLHSLKLSDDTSNHHEKFVVDSIAFHSPSEHTVDGEHFDMEMQIFHTSKEGETLILSQLFHAKEGETNAFLNRLGFENLPKEVGKSTLIQPTNLYSGLPFDKSYFKYEGSLTHPPCSEGVHWRILEHPTFMCTSQLEALQSIIKDNFRPVQPLNDRVIQNSKPLFTSVQETVIQEPDGDKTEIVQHPDGAVETTRVDVGSDDSNTCDGCSFSDKSRQEYEDEAIKKHSFRFKSRRSSHRKH